MNDFIITILGSGSMMPTTRHPAGYLLEFQGKRILIDCGHTTIARLVDMGIDLHSINTLFISHFHTDHFSDAFPFMHARWVDDLSKPAEERQSEPLLIIGPKTLEERWNKLKEVFWPEPKENYGIKFLEGARELEIDGLKIEIFDVVHVSWFPSVGIKVSYGGKTFIYTGDLGSNHPIEDLVERVKNVDVLLIECGTIKPSASHFTIEQVIDLVDTAKVKRAFVTHISVQNEALIQEKVGSRKDIVIAQDNMKILI
jgi:ribonuclease BN (tRNA processing enzyme)